MVERFARLSRQRYVSSKAKIYKGRREEGLQLPDALLTCRSTCALRLARTGDLLQPAKSSKAAAIFPHFAANGIVNPVRIAVGYAH
jgi:hypothetical protein